MTGRYVKRKRPAATNKNFSMLFMTTNRAQGSVMSFLAFKGKDWSCIMETFFNNISILLGILSVLFNMTHFGVPINAINEVIVRSMCSIQRSKYRLATQLGCCQLGRRDRVSQHCLHQHDVIYTSLLYADAPLFFW